MSFSRWCRKWIAKACGAGAWEEDLYQREIKLGERIVTSATDTPGTPPFLKGYVKTYQESLEKKFSPFGTVDNYLPPGHGPGEITVTERDPEELRKAKLDEINRRYAIPQELWDKFRDEKIQGTYYREQLVEYLEYSSQPCPVGTSMHEYAEVVEMALNKMCGVETPPRIHYSHGQEKLVAILPPDLEEDFDVESCEIPEEMLE